MRLIKIFVYFLILPLVSCQPTESKNIMDKTKDSTALADLHDTATTVQEENTIVLDSLKKTKSNSAGETTKIKDVKKDSAVTKQKQQKVNTSEKAPVKTVSTRNKIEKPTPAQPKAIPKAKVATPLKVEEKAVIFFPDTLFDFGFINEGDTIAHTFRFLNNGKAPLEILDVQVSCGCTVPVFPLEAVQPGRLNKIEVTFLSKGKMGSQLATIDILTNAENARETLYLKGVVR